MTKKITNKFDILNSSDESDDGNDNLINKQKNTYDGLYSDSENNSENASENDAVNDNENDAVNNSENDDDEINEAKESYKDYEIENKIDNHKNNKEKIENKDNINNNLKLDNNTLIKNKKIKNRKEKINKNEYDSKDLKTLYKESIEIEINGKKLINESDIVINEKTKYVVLGYNGCGKTSLLKYIYNRLKDNENILMIDQDIEIENNEQTIIDFILTANINLFTNYKLLKGFENKPELNDEEMDIYNSISEKVYGENWDKYESEAKKILHGLGFIDILSSVNILSSGWRMRLALGKFLLMNPTILILDEPTNHLDLESIEGLIKGINEFNGGILLITHDMYLIESIDDYVLYYIIEVYKCFF